jgi:hypothetical protein
MEVSFNQGRAPRSVPSQWDGLGSDFEEVFDILDITRDLAVISKRKDESAMITPEEHDTAVQKDRLIINILGVQFPPGLEWLRDFERSPDTPLRRSYRNGIL